MSFKLTFYLTAMHSATYDVQNVELHGGTRSIFIQCVFASGSQARGCRVEIRNSSIQMIQNITRIDDSLSHTADQTVTGLAPGSYEVLIFDWERDGSFASTPSYTGHINVTAEVRSVPPTTTVATGMYNLIITSKSKCHCPSKMKFCCS